jgi:predicted MFS family arabinose efflux permease
VNTIDDTDNKSSHAGVSGPSDLAYEWKAVTLLALCFGLVGLDRWIIAPLFPFMMKDLNLSYQDLGSVIGILGLAWGVFAIIGGGLSDRIGRRRLMIPAIFAFSILSCLTGLVGGLMSLFAIRAVIGVTEGTFTPACVASTAEASHFKRRGFNQGLQLSTFSLFGVGLAPIIATQLLGVVPSWRWVFFLSIVPGLILTWLLYLVMREPAHLQKRTNEKREHLPWREILKSRNVLLSMFCMMGAMSGIFVLSAMVPSYLSDFIKLSPTSMGFVTSALGFGGFVGSFAVPGISDIFGRRLTAILAFFIAAVFVYLFSKVGAVPVLLFLTLLPVSVCTFGLLALMTGPVPTEAVAPGLVSSAVGITSGTGEIFAGAIMTPIAGAVAEHVGIQYTLYLALAGLILGGLGSLFLKETAPRKVA